MYRKVINILSTCSNGVQMHEGEYLKSFLKKKGFQVKKLAEKLDIPRSTVYNHFKREILKPEERDMYSDNTGIDWIDNKNKNSDNVHDVSNNSEKSSLVTKVDDGRIREDQSKPVMSEREKLVASLEKVIDAQDRLIINLEADKKKLAEMNIKLEAINESLRTDNTNLRSENKNLREELNSLQLNTGNKERQAG